MEREHGRARIAGPWRAVTVYSLIHPATVVHLRSAYVPAIFRSVLCHGFWPRFAASGPGCFGLCRPTHRGTRPVLGKEGRAGTERPCQPILRRAILRRAIATRTSPAPIRIIEPGSGTSDRAKNVSDSEANTKNTV